MRARGGCEGAGQGLASAEWGAGLARAGGVEAASWVRACFVWAEGPGKARSCDGAACGYGTRAALTHAVLSVSHRQRAQVCTDIIHYEQRKLKYYHGNLSEFVKVCEGRQGEPGGGRRARRCARRCVEMGMRTGM